MSFTSIIKIIYGNTYTSYKSNFHLGQQLFSSFSCISARILYDYILDWGDYVLPWGGDNVRGDNVLRKIGGDNVQGGQCPRGIMSGGTMSRGDNVRSPNLRLVDVTQFISSTKVKTC